jgi:hypothetical protein
MIVGNARPRYVAPMEWGLRHTECQNAHFQRACKHRNAPAIVRLVVRAITGRSHFLEVSRALLALGANETARRFFFFLGCTFRRLLHDRREFYLYSDVCLCASQTLGHSVFTPHGSRRHVSCAAGHRTRPARARAHGPAAAPGAGSGTPAGSPCA